MTYLFKLSLIGLTIIAAACSANAKGPKIPYSHQGVTAIDDNYKKEVKWVSVEDIAEQLKGKPPMTVSFDVDDTTLVSSQCFYYGKNIFT